MGEQELIALEALKVIMQFRRNQPKITDDDIAIDVRTAHRYAEFFVEMKPPPKPRGF